MGHKGWVTSIAPPLDPNSDALLSSSRDKSIIVWSLTREEGNYGYARKALRGHSHYVQVRRGAAQRGREGGRGAVRTLRSTAEGLPAKSGSWGTGGRDHMVHLAGRRGAVGRSEHSGVACQQRARAEGHREKSLRGAACRARHTGQERAERERRLHAEQRR